MEAVLADECVPYRAVKACREAGIDILSVVELATGATDERVLEMARSHERLLVTLDADTAAWACRRGPDGCGGVVLVRLRPGSPGAFARLLTRLLDGPCELLGRYTLVYKDRIRQFPLGGVPPSAESKPAEPPVEEGQE